MADLLFALEVVVPLFAAVFLGFFLRKKELMSQAFVDGANKLSFRVILPVLLFYNLITSPDTGTFDAKFMAFAVVGILAIFFVLLLIMPRLVPNRPQCGVMIQGVFRTNFLLFGMQLVANIFGPEGLGPVSMLVAVVVPIFNVLAVVVLAVFSGNNTQGAQVSWKNIGLDIIKNPLIIASVLGIIFKLLPFDLPAFVLKSLKDVSAMATPLALLALGGTLRFESVRKNIKHITGAVLGRLVVVPVIMLGLAILLGFRGEQLAAYLALFTSPVAVSSFVMADQAGCDGQLAAQLIVFTTMFSGFTIFAFVYAFKLLGYI